MTSLMNLKTRWNRRTFLGSAGVVAGTLLNARKAFGFTGAAVEPKVAGVAEKITGFGSTGNVYEELGLTTVINAQGTMTYLGGSLPHPEVEAVMALAGQHFVPIVELEVAAGKRICELLKLPPEYDAIVTCGAAAGMQSGLAGILTGNNPKFIEQIPDLTGMKSEVIIQKSHRNPFDHQLRNTGAKLVVVETREDVKKAINPQTAMMHFSNFANASGQIKVDEWVKLAHENNLPAFIDAAADTPPVSNLWNFAKMGYDLIAFSGGKAIRGPQCAGLLIGKKELVANALLNNSPHEDVIGRSQKVGKEEIVGMVKALEIYLNEDHGAIEKEWWRRLDAISSEVTRVPGVTTSYHVPDVANHVPHMNIFWDPRKISLSPRDASKAMREGKPSVVIGGSESGLGMSSFMLKPGEEKIIAARLVELLKSHTA
jgi:D-glucosaminate-6-phosphate ammonia-lyase